MDVPLDTPNPGIGEGRGAGTRDLLRAFTAISRALNLARPLPETLDLISEKVSRTMGHKSCAVLLANRETGELLIEGSFGLGDEYVLALNTRLKQKIAGDGPESRSVTAQAFRTGMPVYAPDIIEDARFAPWREAALAEGYNSIVALPLIFRDEVIGVLNCYDRPREYTEDQVEALMVVAEQAASAVGIARLISSQRSTIEQLNALNESVTAQHALAQRSEKTHETLAALLLEDRSLNDITGALSNLLDAPVALQDEKLTPRSCSGPEAYGGLIPGVHDLSDLDAKGRAGILGPGPAGGLLLAVPVDLGGRGYLSALVESGAETAFALRTLEQAAVTFALYAARRRARREAEDRVRGDLLDDLLAGRFRSEDEALERAHHLGVDLSGAPIRVLTVRHEPPGGYLEREGLNPGGAGTLRSRLLSLARGFAEGAESPGLAGSDGDQVVLLLPSPPEGVREQAARLVGLVHEEFPGLRLRAAVGAPATRPAGLAARYQEALSLLDLADRLEVGTEVLLYEDWKVYGLVLRGSDRTDLLDLAHRTLDPILSLGPDASRDLLATLHAYLENDLSPTRAAAALYVHPNTVKYRLNKVAGLASLDPGNLDDVLAIKLSLMVRSLDPDGFDARPTD
jgi:sugar diacid utilization regulator/GAF domain-containing protein